MSADLTEAQSNFIEWMAEGGRQCVIDRFSRFVSHGEVKGNGYAATVLRLVAAGYIEGAGQLRLRLTSKGVDAVKPKGLPTCIDRGERQRQWDDWQRQLDEDDMGGGPYG